MATITPGTGGTLKSDSLEQAIAELVLFLQNTETDSAKNASNKDAIQIQMNLNTYTFSCSFSLDVRRIVGTDGRITDDVQPYLTNTGFTVGTNGTLKSATPEATLYEALNLLQIIENTTARNPQGQNRISATLDIDAGTFTGNVNFGIDPDTTTNGAIEVIVEEYLLD